METLMFIKLFLGKFIHFTTLKNNLKNDLYASCQAHLLPSRPVILSYVIGTLTIKKCRRRMNEILLPSYYKQTNYMILCSIDCIFNLVLNCGAPQLDNIICRTLV